MGAYRIKDLPRKWRPTLSHLNAEYERRKQFGSDKTIRQYCDDVGANYHSLLAYRSAQRRKEYSHVRPT